MEKDASLDPQLAAALMHDLKNALGVLEGELFAVTEEPTRERARDAHASCVGLRDRLIGFLTLYKDATQGLSARIDAVCPEDFLAGLARQVRPPAGLGIELQEGMPVLGFFDENLLGLALDAAIQNATRFARSRIWLGCAAVDGCLEFTVRDDGPGLGAVEQKPGTGLGTALCAAIARAHRKGERCGGVSLKNREGGGAEFALRVPQ